MGATICVGWGKRREKKLGKQQRIRFGCRRRCARRGEERKGIGGDDVARVKQESRARTAHTEHELLLRAVGACWKQWTETAWFGWFGGMQVAGADCTGREGSIGGHKMG